MRLTEPKAKLTETQNIYDITTYTMQLVSTADCLLPVQELQHFIHNTSRHQGIHFLFLQTYKDTTA